MLSYGAVGVAVVSVNVFAVQSVWFDRVMTTVPDADRHVRGMETYKGVPTI